MGLRFRKSIKLAPGLRLNASLSGLSWSVGPRGMSMSVGPRGTFFNAGIPGTGLSSRQRVGGRVRAVRESKPTPNTQRLSVMTSFNDEGNLVMQHENGMPFTSELQAAALTQNKAVIMAALETEARNRADAIESLAKIHEDIPDARVPPVYAAAPFEWTTPDKPLEPRPRPHGLFDKWLRKRRERIDAENALAAVKFEQAMATWRGEIEQIAAERRAHDQEEAKRKQLFEVEVRTDPQAMEQVLSETLQEIAWPRETLVSFELRDGGTVVVLDVDLPEVEDMPTFQWMPAKREQKLVKKDLPQTRVRELYMRHIHSLGLRLLGEVFAALPRCLAVVVSGYSQRVNSRTGQTEDQYLYSSHVVREQWLRLNFDSPERIDPVEAFDHFETRREVSKTGVFKPIEPLDAHGVSAPR